MAGHCRETAVDANSQEAAEPGSLGAKRPRVCECGKGHHLGRVRRFQRYDAFDERNRLGDGRADHLNERSTAENLPIRRRLGWAFEKEDGDIVLRHNGRQVGVCLGCLFSDAGERAYVRRIAACQTVPYIRTDGEMRMTANERIPDGIVEHCIIFEMRG